MGVLDVLKFHVDISAHQKREEEAKKEGERTVSGRQHR